VFRYLVSSTTNSGAIHHREPSKLRDSHITTIRRPPIFPSKEHRHDYISLHSSLCFTCAPNMPLIPSNSCSSPSQIGLVPTCSTKRGVFLRTSSDAALVQGAMVCTRPTLQTALARLQSDTKVSPIGGFERYGDLSPTISCLLINTMESDLRHRQRLVTFRSVAIRPQARSPEASPAE
jgi:hypothetical protein